MLTYSLFFCNRKPLISKDVSKEHAIQINLCYLTGSKLQLLSLFMSLTCRKWANTMFMYMSSSSLPLPMKHRCSPLAMEPDSRDCFWASKRDFTDRANSEGFWSICEEKREHIYYSVNIDNTAYVLTQNQYCQLSPGQSPGGRLWTGGQRCTALQADNPPQKNEPHPGSQIHYYHIIFSFHLLTQLTLVIWELLTCCSWLACRISGTDTGRHRAWLRSVSSSFRATRLLPNRFWFIWWGGKSKHTMMALTQWGLLCGCLPLFVGRLISALLQTQTHTVHRASPFWETEGFCSGNTGPKKTNLQCPRLPGEMETTPAFLWQRKPCLSPIFNKRLDKPTHTKTAGQTYWWCPLCCLPLV